MSCFFDSIRDALTTEELRFLGCSRHAPSIIAQLKLRNMHTRDVLWQHEFLAPKAMEENFDHVRCYNAKGYANGYLTSACDPFLLLCCQILKWRITFRYNGATIYMNYLSSDPSSRQIKINWPNFNGQTHTYHLDDTAQRHVKFSASTSHFQFNPV